jgi:hypothetical protein
MEARMPCGCSGSGGWQAEGYEPAPESDIQNPGNFWTGEPAATSDQAEAAGTGAAHWSAKTGTTREPEA